MLGVKLGGQYIQVAIHSVHFFFFFGDSIQIHPQLLLIPTKH